MIKQQFLVFILRWIVSSFGMYLCISWFGTVTSTAAFSAPWVLYLVAGLVFSFANSFIKPFFKIMALPFAILTLGVSTAIINAFMVIVTIYLLPGVEMSFWGALLSSAILSGANTIINLAIS